MSAVIVQLRDYHLRRLEREASDVLGQVLPLAEFAKQGGPCVADPYAGVVCPDGIDGLVYESSLGFWTEE